MKPDGKIKFGEWLPDQPDLDNPGATEARNVIPVSGNYQPYPPMVNTGSAVTGTPLAALRGRGFNTVATNGNLYVVTSSKIYLATGTLPGTFDDVTPGSWSATFASMAQYGENMFITGDPGVPQFAALSLAGSPPAFATLTGTYGNAPGSAIVGTVGQFVVLGNGTSSTLPGYGIQWSIIDSPTDWPTPGSAPAIAGQSGRQLMDAALGTVWGISRGDQWGLVLMDGGIVRMTYTSNPGTVFQFDTVYRGPGPSFPGWWIKVGSFVYFFSPAGFFSTDGVNVTPIGRNKVDQYYLSNLDSANLRSINCGVDYKNRLIYWTLPKSGDSGAPQESVVYNYEENRWTHVFDTVRIYVRGEESVVLQIGVQVFGNNSKVGTLTGTAGSAILATPEFEANPGKQAFLSSVTPQISGSPTVSARIGSRRLQSDAITYTAAISPDAITGDCNCVVDARYHRAEVTVTGAFTDAIGLEYDIDGSSEF